MTSGRDSLLCEILHCGTLDLAMLDRVEYDWCDVLDQLDWPGNGMDFNLLMRGIVSCGIIGLREAIDDRIAELEAIELNERELDEEEAEELKVIRALDPDEDVESYHNWLDTHVWFEKHGDEYREYLADAIEEFENNTGLNFS